MWQVVEKNLWDESGKNILYFNDEVNDTFKGSKIIG